MTYAEQMQAHLKATYPDRDLTVSEHSDSIDRHTGLPEITYGVNELRNNLRQGVRIKPWNDRERPEQTADEAAEAIDRWFSDKTG